MDNSLPFGQPEQNNQNQQNQNQQPQQDQQMKANTFFDAMKAQKDAEEQAKRELHRKLDKRIRELRNEIWGEKKRVFKTYGKWGLIGFGGGIFLGFRKGVDDSVSNDRGRTNQDDNRTA